MKLLFGKTLSDEERMRDTGTFGKKEEINHYSVQYYDFNGNFIKEWPKDNKLEISNELRNKTGVISINTKNGGKQIDSRYELINPLYIASGDQGYIFLADYEGNKIVKFDLDGNVINLWQIEQKETLAGNFDRLSHNRGLFVTNNSLYIVSEGFDRKAVSVFRISEYDLDGNLKREKTIKPPKVAARVPIIDKKIPLLKTETEVTDIIVDKDGNLYLRASDSAILKLDSQWNEKGYSKTVLEEGFEKPKPVYDPDQKREIRYDEDLFKVIGGSLRGFSTDKASWIENGPGPYYANNIVLSPKEDMYVSFIGSKPFGVIDAMIFNKQGEMIGYWKHDKKSYSGWFEKLTDIQKLETMDTVLDVAFYGKDIFIGRTLQEGKATRSYHSVIQKFVKAGE